MRGSLPKTIHLVLIRCGICKEIRKVDRAFQYHYEARRRTEELEKAPVVNEVPEIDTVLLYD